MNLYDDQTDTYKVTYDDGTEEKDIPARLVSQPLRSKPHLREDVVVTTFSRVIDLQNFAHVMKVLPVRGQLNVAHRLGWRNVLNMSDPYFVFDLDFSNHDHWVMMSLLFKLSVVEQGDSGACPGDPCGRNYCHERKMCDCHVYRDPGKFVEGVREHGFMFPVKWDDPR